MGPAHSVEVSAEPGPLPWSLNLLYGVGEIPITVTMALVGLFVLFFYNSVLGLPAQLAGIGIFAGLALDAFLDPYIGHRSDRSRHPLGRRHAYMLTGALAMGPCFFLILSPPRSLGTIGLFLWLVITSMLFRIASAVYRIPYLSLGAELTSHYHERTRLIAVRSLFGLLGMMAAAGLSFSLFFRGGTATFDPKMIYNNYPPLGLVFGTVMTLAGLAAFFGTRSRSELGDPSASAHSWKVFFAGIVLAWRNRSFRNIWLSFTLFYLAVVLNAGLAIQFFNWYAGLHDSKVLSGIQTFFYIGALGGVLLCGWLAKRAEKRTLYLVSMLATAVVLCAATLLFGQGRFFGTGNARPLLFGHLVAGIFASGLWVMPYSMLADVADEDQLSTGLRRGGIYFGMLNFGEKISAGGALLLAGFLLNGFVHLAPGTAVQTPQAISRLGMIYGLVPGCLLAAATLLFLPYRLNRQAVHQIQQRLSTLQTEPTHV